jgi:uncharacterized protein YebE (UPF0316 family)
MDPEIATMFGLALLSVSLWTFRVSITARGLKLASAAMAAVEAVVYVLSFSQLLTDIGSPGRLAGYAAGVAAGTAVGLVLDDRTARGHTELHLVARGDRADLVDRLREQGWPATSSTAAGPEGPVTMMWLTVSDSSVRHVSEQVQSLAPDAFWTLRSLRDVTGSAPITGGSSPADVTACDRRSRLGRVRPTWPARARRRAHLSGSSPVPA